MTIADIQASEKAFLTPTEVGSVLGTDPQTIRVMARQQPELVGFNFTFVGNRMKIPRIAFLRFMGIEV